MLKPAHLSAVAAGTLALTALFVVDPAAAASSLKVSASHARPCLQYGQRSEKCRAYSHRYVAPQDELFPDYGYYRYRFEPPEGTNGPYLGIPAL
jgi:hypothetical protein